MTFVDTSAWFSLFGKRDRNHHLAVRWEADSDDRLVTTDYVLDELLTLLRARGEYKVALIVGKRIIDDSYADIVTVTEDDFQKAWHLFRTYRDKRWSFTDCTSRVVMERLGITTAFAFDDHFRQFANVTVVP